MLKPFAAALGAAFVALPAMAQTPLAPETRDSAVESLATIIADEFFDAERATQIADDLRTAYASGAYREDSAEAFASAIGQALGEEDNHFSVRFVGAERVAQAMARQAERDANPPSEEEMRERWAPLARQNFGFAEVAILPGNIGYIKLNQFAPIAPALDTASAALSFIANTDGVIFDMRQNVGGDPSMVQFLTSHFLPQGGDVLINTFVSRDYEYPNQMWSLPSHPVGHRPHVPMAVLTSGRTGSAGEAFPYHLQAMERATIIGETTYGAGNPGGTFLVEEGFAVFISTGSARNPVTGTNWEGTGVTPDIAVEADDALIEAQLHLYNEISESSEDPEVTRSLNWATEALQAQRNPVELSNRQLRRYVGDWGVRDTFMEDGRLHYVREGASPIALIALGNDRFMFEDDENYRLVFVEGEDGFGIMELHTGDGRIMPNARVD
ncbi:S41 family peptidase [Maricaulis sp.]|uniref:S41 family peptidase n=1 Tax=Maricaulis sp. TaxID=1486257 RepID=UPI0026340170|nr:S41 family peptidase [Maricaulis sp.]